MKGQWLRKQLTLSRYCQVKCESPSSVMLMKTYNGINQLASLKLYPGSLKTLQENMILFTQKIVAHDTCDEKLCDFITIYDVYCGICYIKIWHILHYIT
jgi:hypothetical protein